jgi:hypothetical protein
MLRGNTGEWRGAKDIESYNYDWDIFGWSVLHWIGLNRSGKVYEERGGKRACFEQFGNEFKKIEISY